MVGLNGKIFSFFYEYFVDGAALVVTRCDEEYPELIGDAIDADCVFVGVE